MNRCIICNQPFEAKRSDARLCSARCRKKATREGIKLRGEKIVPPQNMTELEMITDKATKPPETFQDYLNAIKWETWTHSTIKAFLRNERKLTMGQRDMIFSKLKN